MWPARAPHMSADTPADLNSGFSSPDWYIPIVSGAEGTHLHSGAALLACMRVAAATSSLIQKLCVQCSKGARTVSAANEIAVHENLRHGAPAGDIKQRHLHVGAVRCEHVALPQSVAWSRDSKSSATSARTHGHRASERARALPAPRVPSLGGAPIWSSSKSL